MSQDRKSLQPNLFTDNKTSRLEGESSTCLAGVIALKNEMFVRYRITHGSGESQETLQLFGTEHGQLKIFNELQIPKEWITSNRYTMSLLSNNKILLSSVFLFVIEIDPKNKKFISTIDVHCKLPKYVRLRLRQVKTMNQDDLLLIFNYTNTVFLVKEMDFLNLIKNFNGMENLASNTSNHTLDEKEKEKIESRKLLVKNHADSDTKTNIQATRHRNDLNSIRLFLCYLSINANEISEFDAGINQNVFISPIQLEVINNNHIVTVLHGHITFWKHHEGVISRLNQHKLKGSSHALTTSDDGVAVFYNRLDVMDLTISQFGNIDFWTFDSIEPSSSIMLKKNPMQSYGNGELPDDIKYESVKPLPQPPDGKLFVGTTYAGHEFRYVFIDGTSGHTQFVPCQSPQSLDCGLYFDVSPNSVVCCTDMQNSGMDYGSVILTLDYIKNYKKEVASRLFETVPVNGVVLIIAGYLGLGTLSNDIMTQQEPDKPKKNF